MDGASAPDIIEAGLDEDTTEALRKAPAKREGRAARRPSLEGSESVV